MHRNGKLALSPAQQNVLQMRADGWTVHTIAEVRGTAVDTVKHQCMEILAVLDADTMNQAVAIGIRRSLID
jgi:DNA-binding NarL/FixJ family response regulator